MLLVGDIGGTKTDLAIFPTNGATQPQIQDTFRSGDFPSLEAVIEAFLAEAHVGITQAVFGVAGPVVNGQSKITNLPWHISEAKLRNALKLPAVKLLNDLEAISHAVPHLSSQDLVALNSEPMNSSLGFHKAVIAPGTGLGEAIIFYTEDTYHVLASEGGHADFAPTTLLEIGLLKHVLGEFGHVSYERVCSGSLGIPTIHSYLKGIRFAPESPEIATALQENSDPTPIIIQAGLQEQCKLCQETLNLFVSILGSAAGNLALKVMATGGIYLGGGIPPRIVPKLKDGTFMAAFVKKGRLGEMLAGVPVHVILNKNTALIGALHYYLNFKAKIQG